MDGPVSFTFVIDSETAVLEQSFPRLSRTVTAGTLAGAAAAIAVLVLLTPFLLNRVTAIPLDDATARVDPIFDFTGLDVILPELFSAGNVTLFTAEWTLTPLFMLSVAGMIGFGIAGAITVGLTRWIPRIFDPNVIPTTKGSRLYANGILIGAVIGLLAAQFAVEWLGTSTPLSVQIRIFPFLATLVVAGVTLGATVSGTTHIIERPDVVGVEGHTWESRGEFLSAARRAVTFPLVALGVIAVIVIVFGVLLLVIHDLGTAGPIVFASVLTALILGGASFVAYRK